MMKRQGPFPKSEQNTFFCCSRFHQKTLMDKYQGHTPTILVKMPELYFCIIVLSGTIMCFIRKGICSFIVSDHLGFGLLSVPFSNFF